MQGASNNKTEIAIDEPVQALVTEYEVSLEREIEALKKQLENELRISRKLEADIAEKDHKIAAMQATLKEVGAEVQEKLVVIQRVRASCEEDARQVAQIKTLQANTLDMCDSKIRELMDVMDGVEEGVRKIYQSRRWRFANIVLWVKGFFRSRAKRPFRGYWRIDTRLAEYRVWRDRYLSRND